MSHVHLTKEDLIGSYEWKGNLDLLNIIMLGLAKNLPEHDETVRTAPVCWEHCYPKYSLWDGVMMEVLKKDIVDENYNISLREMIDELYNNNDHRFVNGYDVYKEMLSDEEKENRFLNVLPIHQ